MKFTRTWAMPNADTFSVKPIGEFVQRYLSASKVSIDPFARNSTLATHTNDLDKEEAPNAQHHMDAEDFLRMLAQDEVRADLVIHDPPHSTTQMRRVYKGSGLERDGGGTRNSELYARVRDAIPAVLSPEGIVLSFGWNSAGMGKKHGFEILEILLVCHGGAHNDTICMAERRTQPEGLCLD